MITITEQARQELKKPLGELLRDPATLKEMAKGRRIIAVGDVCVLNLLAAGISPHLAVFDFRSKRQPLDSAGRRILETHYPKPKTYTNPPGALSEELLRDAPSLIREGGAVLIDGEEDLTAMAFIMSAGPQDVVVYGQPDEGLVIVKPDEKIRKKIEKWLGK